MNLTSVSSTFESDLSRKSKTKRKNNLRSFCQKRFQNAKIIHTNKWESRIRFHNRVWSGFTFSENPNRESDSISFVSKTNSQTQIDSWIGSYTNIPYTYHYHLRKFIYLKLFKKNWEIKPQKKYEIYEILRICEQLETKFSSALHKGTKYQSYLRVFIIVKCITTEFSLRRLMKFFKWISRG